MILCYLDTSEKNISIDVQQKIVVDYATKYKNIEIFIKDSDISFLIKSLTENKNTILLANVVCLGKTLKEIRNNIDKLVKKQCTIVLISENRTISPKKNAKNVIQGLDYALDMRNSLSSIITKKVLAEKKAQGFTLGRKSRNRKRILDDKQDEIILRKLKGETNLQIAQALEVTPTTLYSFYRQHPEIKKLFTGESNA